MLLSGRGPYGTRPLDWSRVKKACAAIRSGRGKVNRDKDFAGLQNILPRTGAKIFDGNLARAVATGDGRGPLQDDHGGNGIARGRGVTQVATNAGPPLNGGATDE